MVKIFPVFITLVTSTFIICTLVSNEDRKAISNSYNSIKYVHLFPNNYSVVSTKHGWLYV